MAARAGAYVYTFGGYNLILRSANGGAQWTQVHRGPLGADLSTLFSAAFAGPARGWAVGRASVLASSDRGLHWSSQYAGTSRLHLDDVATSDPRHAWVVGHSYVTRGGLETPVAVILATTDGGATWHVQSTPPLAWLTGVAFADARHGWAVGEDQRQLFGVILATADAGAHWRVQGRYKWTSLRDVACANPAHVWAVGGPDQYPVSTLTPTPAMILASADAGAHWQVQLAADDGTDSDMTGVDFVDAEHGWVVGGGGRGIVLATGDGGRTWKALATVAAKVNGHLNYNSVSFADARHGWIVANHSVLITTSDGGATWQAITPPGDSRLLTGVCAIGPGG